MYTWQNTHLALHLKGPWLDDSGSELSTVLRPPLRPEALAGKGHTLPNCLDPHLLRVLLGSGGGAAVFSTPCVYSPVSDSSMKEPSKVKPLG